MNKTMYHRIVEAGVTTYYRSSATWHAVLSHHSIATDPPPGADPTDPIVGATFDTKVEIMLCDRGINPDRISDLSEEAQELLSEAEHEEDEATITFMVNLVACSREAKEVRLLYEDLDREARFLPSGGAVEFINDYQSKWIRRRERYQQYGR
jgi:hypothetical protein